MLTLQYNVERTNCRLQINISGVKIVTSEIVLDSCFGTCANYERVKIADNTTHGTSGVLVSRAHAAVSRQRGQATLSLANPHPNTTQPYSIDNNGVCRTKKCSL